jgi:cytochrome c oxidase subunit 2
MLQGLVLHTPASAHGAEVDNLMNITWILIFIVQAITQVLLYYFAFKYRGRKDRKALYLIIVGGTWVLFLPSYWLG